MNLLLLAFVGIAEAVIYHFRYRSAVKDCAFTAGKWATWVCITRIAFTYLGVSSVIAGEPLVLCVLAYALPAGVATSITHKLERVHAAKVALQKLAKENP